MGRRRARSRSRVRVSWNPADSRADARGRLHHRSDRPLAPALLHDSARFPEERHHHRPDRQPQGPGVTLVRRPYLQQMSSTARCDRLGDAREWRSERARCHRVDGAHRDGRRAASCRRREAASASTTTITRSSIGGLSAATAYTYDAALGSAAVMSAGFRTAPATRLPATRRSSCSATAAPDRPQQRQLATLMSNDTFDVALHAGDIVYGSVERHG